MKNIKFRAWDSQTKRFIQDDVDVENRENHDLGNYALDPSGVLYFFQSDEGGMSVFEKKNAEIMQSTGLKDKNGKEIYEGDILKKAGIVSWNDVEVRWSCVDIEWNDNREWHDMLYLTTPLEIIGNIYENPELIAK